MRCRARPGAVEGDRIEAQAIREILGDVPVTAPKSFYGYLGAASGALEAAVGVLSLQCGQVPPTLHYKRPDPQCPIRVVHGQPQPLEHPPVLILTYSKHGQAAAIVVVRGVVGFPCRMRSFSREFIRRVLSNRGIFTPSKFAG